MAKQTTFEQLSAKIHTVVNRQPRLGFSEKRQLLVQLHEILAEAIEATPKKVTDAQKEIVKTKDKPVVAGEAQPKVEDTQIRKPKPQDNGTQEATQATATAAAPTT